MNKQQRLLSIAQQFVKPQRWPSLLGIIGHWEDETLNMVFFFSKGISDELREDASVLATEILAQFSEGLVKDKCVHWNSTDPLPASPFWIYKI